MRPLRLFVEATLGTGATLAPTPAQAHYLLGVMRRRAGDAVLLFNGRDGEWRAEIADVARRGCALRLVERTRPQDAAPDLWLLFAPVKRAGLDLVARAATELGVAALVPMVSGHTVAARLNLERLRANASEAAEQCGRLTVPACRPPATLDAIVDAWPRERRLLLCEPGDGAPIARALPGAAMVPASGAAGPWAVAIGPEGGFEAAEVARLAALPGAVRACLGPRILRAETATIAALACWQALIGDWRNRDGGRGGKQ